MAKPNVWMSVSDLMTGLMVIFLFITVSYMSQIRRSQQVLVDYVDTKQKLHDTLVASFSKDTAKWQMQIGKDLSMKFTNANVQFQSGQWKLQPEFEERLDSFLPRYFDILLNSPLKDKIQEIRIEGHTDNVPYPTLDKDDPYIANIILSQRRALEVVKYFRQMPAYKAYTNEQKKQLEYWFTANGLSYGKSLDSNGEYTQKSGNPIDKDRSRRVEFRIITTGDEVLEDFVEHL